MTKKDRKTRTERTRQVAEKESSAEAAPVKGAAIEWISQPEQTEAGDKLLRWRLQPGWEGKWQSCFQLKIVPKQARMAGAAGSDPHGRRAR